MDQGLKRFLFGLLHKPVAISTLAPQQARVVGALEKVEEDTVLVRSRQTGGQVCIRAEMIVTVEEVIEEASEQV